MLLLKRKTNQTVMIGDQCEVYVVAICGDSVTLGIRAPAEVPVHRREVYELIERQKLDTQGGVTCKI